MLETVRTRFAPSPTGYLHIGGARTALFNYALARRLGGKFILRIEDTDQTRNIENADARLIEDLRWLGLHWDEGPQVGGPAGAYHQSRRLEQYTATARTLLDSGKAYYAWDTPAELDAMRAAAQQQKRNFRYPRPSRFPSEADARAARESGRPVVIRFKVPEHDYVVSDCILGDVRIGAGELDDFVIIKSDGWPTYHFAVVVDDQDMLVTHVLRGQEHLMNTPRHLALQEALAYRVPIYAHLPIIQNMDGSKMSKREKDRTVRTAAEAALAAGRHAEAELLEIAACDDDALFAAWRRGDTQLPADALRRLARALRVGLPEIEIHDFRVSGYLPEVILNFIALLGWSPGEDREKMTLPEICELFSVERVGKTNARFDRDKLLNFNTTALAAADPRRRLAGCRDWLSVQEDSLLAAAGLDDATLMRLMEMCSGFRTFRDLETKAGALFTSDSQVQYDPDAVQKVLLKGGLDVLREVRGLLAGLPDFSPASIDAAIRGFCESKHLGLGKVAQPLRVAVTGTTVSPPINDTLALLGKEHTLARVDRALLQAGAS